MNLKIVTITGADTTTDIEALMDLSAEFPFVEWGILVSRRSEGDFRFPQRQWIDRFALAAEEKRIRVSTHVCGRWVRAFVKGELDWAELPGCIRVSQRIQINTHAEEHVSTVGMFESMRKQPLKKFIFQWDGVNDHLTYAAFAAGFEAQALFDTSGGAGILPAKWPVPDGSFPCGYAGGLGPGNVLEQVRKIERVCCNKPYWIDMERRVRAEDDSFLDLAKVRSVLETVRDFMRAVPALA